ncbi:MAG: aminotransferase class I/II-fold pyridoxal phosphate-dependent enzyme [Bacteroidetes bacterium]|nr:aminotransferase class I/II-fold pyridoxal phosphate-dependent enzyme [Bacteroidota bacterium]
MLIDLRSDTITKPTPGMLEAMMQAEVGDNVFNDDPSVLQLERKAASMFGTESALFCVSGTMTNQLAIRAHCSPGSEVVCDKLSHVYLYEGGGIALNAFSSVRTLEGNRGRITAAQVEEAINNKQDIHLPVTRMVSLENTMNKGGGSIYDFEEIVKIKKVCEQHHLKLHLDGARIFNALVETNESPMAYGNIFDSISICLSKGLGCPVGSLLLGSEALITQAKRFRKVMGGGWRQAGYLAACGIYALDHHIDRLKEDHRRAKMIGEILSQKEYVKSVYPIETNIVIFELAHEMLASDFASRLSEKGLLCIGFGKHLVRFVTHLDFTDAHLEALETILNNAS